MARLSNPGEEVSGPEQKYLKPETYISRRRNDPGEYAREIPDIVYGSKDNQLKSNAIITKLEQEYGFTGPTALQDLKFPWENTPNNTIVSNYPSFEQAAVYASSFDNPITTREGEIVYVNDAGVAMDGSTPVAASKDSKGNPILPSNTTGSTTSGNTSSTVDNTANQNVTRTALQDFSSALERAGLGTLAETLNQYIIQDKPASEIKLLIRESQAYKDRFPGMAALSAKKVAVNEGTYIDMERGYLETLHAYGVDSNVFGTREQLGKYISNMTSPREFDARVSMAVDRVKANPDVVNALSTYYGVDTSSAVSYLLDPGKGMDIIKKQVRASEIGAAAAAGGFMTTGVLNAVNAGYAESLAAQGNVSDMGTLKSQFGQARILADTQKRLSELEGEKGYSDLEAVGAIVGNDSQKMLASQKRAAREAARFNASSGVSSGSLRKQSNI